MLKFIVRSFAVIGFLITLSLVLLIVVAVGHDRIAKEPNNVVLAIDLDRPIVEQNEPSPFDFAFDAEEPVALFDLVKAIDHAKDDSHVKGLVVHFGTTEPSLAQVQEIRDAIKRFRSSGKLTYAFATSYGNFGLSNRDYYLASAFENIWLQPVGSVGLTGLALQEPFFKSLLDKAEVKADFMQREEYKSFMEPGMRDDFSPPVRANMQALLDDLTLQISGGVAEGRQWSNDKVRQLMAQGPFTANEAMKANLVTHIGYDDQLDQEIKDKAGADAKSVKLEQYESYFHDQGKRDHAIPKIALIYGVGMITEQADRIDSVTDEKVMSPRKIVKAFDDAVKDKRVRAILFRIDSPGGSPEASETIRRALDRAKEQGKPVYVSMGGVAASGGYWIAMDADRIVAEPGTLTGSIGVVAGKFALGGLLKKIGVNWGVLASDESAALWSFVNEFTPAQRARVNTLLDETYQNFIVGVANGRHIPIDQMPALAKGRVWTGAAASKVGLVDELGGITTTLSALKKKIGLKDTDDVYIEEYPHPQSPAEKILHMLKGMDNESASFRGMLSAVSSLRSVLAPWLDVAHERNPVSVRVEGLDSRLDP